MIKLKKGLFEGSGTLTQKFGENPAAYSKFGLLGHNGIDYGIPVGTKLFSAINGKVTESAFDQYGYGNYIKIENDSCGILYGHFKELSLLKVGSVVTAGQLIALSGNTGNSTGPHLHFGVFPQPRDRSNGYSGYIDPLNKALVEWVDEFVDEVALLKVELTEMRASRDSWKAKHAEISTQLKKALYDLNACNTNKKTMTELLEGEMKARKELEDKLKEADALIERLRQMQAYPSLDSYTLKELIQEVFRKVVGK